MRTRRGSRPVALAAVLALPLAVGCGGDNGPTGTNSNTIVGTWVATSLTAPTQPQWGDAITDDGLSIRFTFSSSGGYSLTVGGDYPADPWICNNTASCTITGSYSTSGNTVLFDEGTQDEHPATYSISGSTLTLTFAAIPGIPDPYRYVFRKA